MNPARVFLLITAIVHIPLGIVGFLYDRSFPLGAEATEAAGSAYIVGLLETNGWHTLGALIVGLAALYGCLNAALAGRIALGLGLFHVWFFVSLLIWEPSTFNIASNAADQVIHASTALGGTITGIATSAPKQKAPA